MTTFEQIASLLDNLEKVISVYRSEIGDQYMKEQVLIDLDHRLVANKKALEEDVRKFEDIKLRISEEQKYLDKIRKEQDFREGFLKKETKRLAEAQTALDAKKLNLDTQEKSIKEQMEALKGLQDKEKELADRETILAREKTIDTERKHILDLREKKNETERARLQRISDSLS